MSGEMMLFPDTVDEFMEQYKLVDEDHVYSNGTAFVPIFRMKQWFDHLQAPHFTNADRIRSMTDEELTNFYFDFFFPQCPYCECDPGKPCPEHNDCKICLLEWLKQKSGEA